MSQGQAKVTRPRSVGQQFRLAVEQFGDGVAMRSREPDRWVDLTWRQYGRTVQRLGAELCAMGIGPGDRVAILSNSRVEWAVIDQATLSIGAVTVPIYQSNLPHEVQYILEHSGATVVFAEDSEQLGKVLQVRGELDGLKHTVLIQGKVKTEGFILAYDKLLERGKAALASQDDDAPQPGAEIKPDDLATIVYTSGTTGPPKGAMLTHGNLLYEMEALAPLMGVGPQDETLLFLPMAHIFARIGYMVSIKVGYTVSFAEAIERLMDNLLEIRPTFMFSVPRIYEKVYNKVLSGVQAGSRLKKQIFAFAMAVGRAVSRRLQRGQRVPFYLSLPLQVAELLVFNKLKRLFGGELRFFISGGAPLSREIAEFFHSAGILVLEGYGLTENTAASNLNTAEAFRLGTVGKALPEMEVLIADDGEILLRGPNVFAGYFRHEEATAEAMGPYRSSGEAKAQDKDKGGDWFHTGDIGVIDGDGFLKITDRKKDLIVTSGGKNIAPQNLENLFKTDPMISQVMVYGDKRNYLTALVTLDPDEAAAFAERKEIDYEELAELARHPLVRERVERGIERKNVELASYETIKKIAILEQDFEVGEELTPTLKVKRKFAIKKYWDLLDGLYQDSGGTK